MAFINDIVKQPAEQFPLNINFNSWLSASEELSTVAVYVNDELIPGSGYIVDSYAIVSGTYVQLNISGGVDGEDYKLTARPTTTSGNIFEFDLRVSIREDSSSVVVNDYFSYRLSYDTELKTIYIIPGVDSTLENNTEYIITVYKGLAGLNSLGVAINPLQEDFVFYFTTKYCPLFTSLNAVKLEAGVDAELLEDDTIYRMIYKNSKDILDLFNHINSAPANYSIYGCGPGSSIPFQFRRYVECKTAYDVLALVDMLKRSQTGGFGGSQLKTLGDMTIKYDSATPSAASIATDPGKKANLYKCFNDIFDIISTKRMQVAVRGIDNTSKGYSHPVLETDRLRLNRDAPWFQQNRGPWDNYRRTF